MTEKSVTSLPSLTIPLPSGRVQGEGARERSERQLRESAGGLSSISDAGAPSGREPPHPPSLRLGPSLSPRGERRSGDAVAAVTARLAAAGVAEPRREARLLAAAALGVTRDQVAWGHSTPVSHLYGHGPQFGRTP